jgi:hypothetical protein
MSINVLEHVKGHMGKTSMSTKTAITVLIFYRVFPFPLASLKMQDLSTYHTRLSLDIDSGCVLSFARYNMFSCEMTTLCLA